MTCNDKNAAYRKQDREEIDKMSFFSAILLALMFSPIMRDNHSQQSIDVLWCQWGFKF